MEKATNEPDIIKEFAQHLDSDISPQNLLEWLKALTPEEQEQIQEYVWSLFGAAKQVLGIGEQVESMKMLLGR